ncbi:MAG TPA: hypothetical protein VFM86_11840 [Pedococcus sp.]|nr:hypothetical protein [Pedococcus sp.]
MSGGIRGCCYGSPEHGERPTPSRLDAWCVHRQRRAHVRGLADTGVLRGGGAPSDHLNRFHTPDVPGFVEDGSTLLVYVVDLYDPSAYEYLPSVSAVLRGAACRRVDVEIVQTGRYAAPAVAAGVIALLASEEAGVSQVIEAVQRDFFVGGHTLDEPGVLARVANDLQLDAPAIELFAGGARAAQLAADDVMLAKDLDRGGGPLLLASRGTRVFEFDGLGATGARLVDQFHSVLDRP